MLSTRDNVIVIADEAHRSQYGFTKGFARWLGAALPNARRLGFTGTPVSFSGADTVEVFGDLVHVYDNDVKAKTEAAVKKLGFKLTAAQWKLLWGAFTTKDETAEPVIQNKTKDGVAYEPDSDLRDTEQVPLLEPGGIEAFFDREVKPHAPDAWIDREATKIGYEVSFTRYFYKPPALRTLEQIRADILALEAETEGLLSEIVGGVARAGQPTAARGKR